MSNKEILKRNESCIIGLPRCDYVFNSSRACFIAYGFDESKLEMDILSSILKENSVEVYEAGGSLEPGKNAFCTKICSKIITSQFCIVLLNNDTKNDKRIPNANVNMEYGLMLGFNKYVIPFQKEDDNLPFNVSGLDTIKYSKSNFKQKAEKAIIQAIEQTRPKITEPVPITKLVDIFLLIKNAFVCPLDEQGHKNLYDLGSPLGYYLLNDFSGVEYYYLGIFNTLSIDQIKWRINKLIEVLDARFNKKALEIKVKFGVIEKEMLVPTLKLKELMKCWIIVQTEDEKKILQEFTSNFKTNFEIFSIDAISKEIENHHI